MEGVLGFIVTVGITFLVSLLLAVICLRGVIRLVTGEERREAGP